MLTIWFPGDEPRGLEERVQWLRNRHWLAQHGHLVDSPEGSAGPLLVVTDPLFVAAESLIDRLIAAAAQRPENVLLPAAAASPLEDGSSIALAYSTPRELSADAASHDAGVRRIRWHSKDLPVMLLLPARAIAEIGEVRQILADHDVYVVEDAIVHRFASLRGNRREDLAARIPASATSILDLGCGEGLLGASIKTSRSIRVVGIETDPEAARIAREKLDEVHTMPIEDALASLPERFDVIVAGDVLEHLIDPWTTLHDLRGVAHAQTRIIASIPNIASWPIVADLLAGRFDYVYAGLLCAGHLRFFTRTSIVEMFHTAGWKIENLDPQPLPDRADHAALRDRLSNIELSSDLGASGFIVVATPV